MNLQQLRYAIEIAECGSINNAAKNLFVSQPSLSSAIMELEKEFGVTLFTRTSKGINVTVEGVEFLSYARQVLEQADLLESRYRYARPSRQRFAISAQHSAFAVSAFVRLVEQYGRDEYEFALRETKTYEIIDDVRNLRSEIGILYMNEFNAKVLTKFLREGNLVFTKLFEARPHIFISARNPLAQRACVTLDDLEPYPCLSFEQGEYNSFHFSEEILSTLSHPKSIRVSDRATLFNLLIGLNGYTISTGVISHALNGNEIIAVPLQLDETIRVGYIMLRNMAHSALAEIYIQLLKETIAEEQRQL